MEYNKGDNILIIKTEKIKQIEAIIIDKNKDKIILTTDDEIYNVKNVKHIIK